MELRLSVGGEIGYGTVCRSSARMIASSNSTLSFSNTFRNPFLSSLLCMPHLDQEKQKKTSISARIEWQRDQHLDDVIQRQKKVKFVTKLKDLLVKEPGMCMSLRQLGKIRKKLGLEESRRLVTLLKRYSAVFDLFEEGASNMYFRLSPAAEEIFLAEQKLKAEMESLHVNKIRKLLMMSIDKTLLIFKISHLKKDLGLPDDFKTNLLEKYPEYFKVVELESGPALELTSWDPELAISAWERNVERGSMNTEIRRSGRPAYNVRRCKLPKDYHLKRKDVDKIRRFHEMSYFSPYSEFAHIEPASKEAERHACAVIHEILSMTLEKRLNIDFLTHFRKDYKFSQQLHGMLVRHPELFYVSLKGDRHSVFLREGYRRSELIVKDPLMVLKEKLRMLVAQSEEATADDKDDDDGITDKAGFSDDDLSEEALEVFSSEIYEGLRQAMPRRPLNVVQREEEMPALIASAERW